jgi:hypothetical protein
VKRYFVSEVNQRQRVTECVKTLNGGLVGLGLECSIEAVQEELRDDGLTVRAFVRPPPLAHLGD